MSTVSGGPRFFGRFAQLFSPEARKRLVDKHFDVGEFASLQHLHLAEYQAARE
jgi:hypothetical protein